MDLSTVLNNFCFLESEAEADQFVYAALKCLNYLKKIYVRVEVLKLTYEWNFCLREVDQNYSKKTVDMFGFISFFPGPPEPACFKLNWSCS